jgi:glycine C-acetyltransferase
MGKCNVYLVFRNDVHQERQKSIFDQNIFRMYSIQQRIQREIEEIKSSGLYKTERIITTPQGADISTTAGKEVINFCANNYLGLSSHPKVIDAAKRQ